MRFFFLLSLLLAGSLFSPRCVFAAGAGLTVTPVFQEVALEENQQEAQFSISLVNNSDGPLALRLSVVDFGSLDESGGVAFLGPSDDLVRKYALASWMRPEKDVVSLAPGESEALRVVIENRESLSPGGHYGAVLFQVGNEEGSVTDDNTVAVNQLVSVLVFAKKQGGEIYSLNLRERVWEKSFFRGIQQVSLRFQNEGNVHLVPRGMIIVRDPLGRAVQKGVINSESGIVLPESQRTFVTKFVELAPLFIPGRYTLLTEYRYDGREVFETTLDTRILLPWPFVAGVGVVSILVIVRYLRRKKDNFFESAK